MSLLSLDSVLLNNTTKITEPDFYVAAIAYTYSGYYKLTLITDSQTLLDVYGEFPYYYEYKCLIDNKIPVLLTPIITKLSDYNRTSLRLSNGNIKVSHPKYKKEYTYVSLGNIYYYPFTESDLDIFNSFTIDNPLNFYPQIVIDESNASILSSVKYYTESDKTKIQVTFSKSISGGITIEGLPQVDSDTNYIKTGTFLNDKGKFSIQIPTYDIPEVVITDYEGNLVDTEINLTTVNGLYYVEVNISNIDNKTYRYDIRIIPSNLIVTRRLIQLNSAIGNIKYYANFKVAKEDIESLGYTEYRNNDSAVVTISDYNDTILKYNLIATSSEYDIDRIYSGELTFNTILDLSNITDDIISDGVPDYILLDLNGTNTLISTSANIPFNVTKTYYTEIWYPTDKITTVKEFIKLLKQFILSKLGTDKCTDLTDRLVDFMNAEFDKYGIPTESSHYLWETDIYNDMYATDFWVGTNSYVYEKLSDLFSNVPYNDNYRLNAINYILNNSNIDNNKLLLEYSIPCNNLNHYSFDKAVINQSYNLGQDKLCELTEMDKICEFYSKVKGDGGKKIKVTIQSNPLYNNVYTIVISLNSNIEHYYVYTYKDSDTPSDCISFDEIGLNSKLVITRIFDYVTSSGKLVDQFTLDPLTDEFDSNNLRNRNELILPEGTFYLDRVLDENYTYSDIKDTTESFIDSGWYPDLFLIDSIDFGTNTFDYLKYISKEFLGYLFSQAFITVSGETLSGSTGDNLKTLLLSSDNRSVYFYDYISYNDNTISSFYPYIVNLFSANYLKSISSNIIADSTLIKVGNYVLYNNLPRLVSKIKSDVIYFDGDSTGYDISEVSTLDDYLKKYHVNNILYNNLYYYYLTYYEPIDQASIFIIRFITSKISRLFMINKRYLISMDDLTVTDELNNVTSIIKSLFNIVSGINISHTQVNNTLSLEVTTNIKYLVNKIYKVNVLINK
jgi:hypothetical protein